MQNHIKNEESESDEKVGDSREKFNLKGDYGNIAILCLLYVLQGDKQTDGNLLIRCKSSSSCLFHFHCDEFLP